MDFLIPVLRAGMPTLTLRVVRDLPMESPANPIPIVWSPAEVVRIAESNRGAAIGIVVASEQRPRLFDALVDLLSHSHRPMIRVTAGERLSLKPKATLPALPAESLTDWRDRIGAELRAEQKLAQDRVDSAKQRGESADASDREVAGWLATGLCDLLADPITGESFIAPGRGTIARWANDDKVVRFTEADFLRPEGIRFMEAGRPAQSMLTKLSLVSTSQFRAAAARLLNRVLDRLIVAIEHPAACQETVLLVDDSASVDESLTSAPFATLIVAATDEAILRDTLGASAILCRFDEPTPAIVVSPDPEVTDTSSLAKAYEIEFDRARLFIERGLLDQMPHAFERDQSEVALDAARQALANAWRQWFARRLADFDAEWFVSFEEFSMFAKTIASLQESWRTTAAVGVRLPAVAGDFDLAESIIAELLRLQRQWALQNCRPGEEGMVFDAAVAAGGASLDMLADGVKWWLWIENQDWRKYRIVRVDE